MKISGNSRFPPPLAKPKRANQPPHEVFARCFENLHKSDLRTGITAMLSSARGFLVAGGERISIVPFQRNTTQGTKGITEIRGLAFSLTSPPIGRAMRTTKKFEEEKLPLETHMRDHGIEAIQFSALPDDLVPLTNALCGNKPAEEVTKLGLAGVTVVASPGIPRRLLEVIEDAGYRLEHFEEEDPTADCYFLKGKDRLTAGTLRHYPEGIVLTLWSAIAKKERGFYALYQAIGRSGIYPKCHYSNVPEGSVQARAIFTT
jgi:hypothetical protein